MKLTRILAFLAPSLLAACSAVDGWEYRYGPDPSVPLQKVKFSTAHQIDIMQQFDLAANCSVEGRVGSPECAYAITLAGFNFIDEQCDAYLHELFVMDKGRDRWKAALQAADKMSNAVLATVSVSKTTMAIVAQSFGLSSQLLDVSTDSYLYKTNPGTILHIVAELQRSYRDSTEKNKHLLVSHPAIYSQIRGYLRLCLPPTIESKIENALAKATGVSGKEAVEPPEKASAPNAPGRDGQGTSQATGLVVQ
jgi:hypothetical protein